MNELYDREKVQDAFKKTLQLHNELDLSFIESYAACNLVIASISGLAKANAHGVESANE